MKWIFKYQAMVIIILLLIPFNSYAENDVDENRNTKFKPEILAQWDLLFGPIDIEAATGDNRQVGCCYGAGYFWTTGASDMSQTWIYQWDMNWNLLNSWHQAAHSTGWGWRDMCFDGSYLYASPDIRIDQIDPATGQWTGVSMQGVLIPNRALAYDDNTDHFFTVNFSSDIYELDRNGSVINSWDNTYSVYGAAYVQIQECNEDMLWVHHQGNCVLAQFDPSSGTYTGVTFDVEPIQPGAIAGGVDFYHYSCEYAFLVLGQGSPDFVASYEYCETCGIPDYRFTANLNILTPRVPSIGGTIFFDIEVWNTGANAWPVYGEIYPTIGDCASGTSLDFNINRLLVSNLNPAEGYLGHYYYQPGDVSGYNLSNVALRVDVGRAIDDWAASDCDEFTFYNPFGRIRSPNAAWNTEFFERGDIDVEIPAVTTLGNNYPNPFNTATTIPFTLSEPGYVSLKIYNLKGQEIETLADLYMNAGSHRIGWDASLYASGIYFYKLTANDKVITKRMILLK